jgi:hydroxypyruvate isomerase
MYFFTVSTQFALVMANDLQILVFVSVINIISSLDIFHFQSIQGDEKKSARANQHVIEYF